MDTAIYLTAVTLSQSATLAIGNVRRAIYRTNGAVSAYAFPALIPLAWSAYRPLSDRLPYLARPQHPITASALTPVSSSWFISLDDSSTHRVEQWQQEVERSLKEHDAEGISAGLFPCFPGIFLCSGAGRGDTAPAVSIEPIPAVNDARITCFDISYDDSCPWWEDLTYSQLWSKHIS